MQRRRCGPALVLAMVAALAAAAGAGEEPSAEYAGAMRTLDTAAREIAAALAARDHAAMNEQIILARPAIELVQQYWRERESAGADQAAQVEDAVDAIRTVSKSVSEISVAVHLMSLSPNPLAVEGAELALINLHAACAACHAGYREEQADGRYLIR